MSLAASAAMLLLLPPAVILPLMESNIQNLVFERSRLVSSIPAIYQEVWFPFALGFIFFAVVFPATRALILVTVLSAIRWNLGIPSPGHLFRWSEELRTWSMTDVVAIAGIIAYFRAAIPADVDILIGSWCYFGVAVLAFVADRSLDRRAVWNAIRPDRDEDRSGRTVACGVCELAVGERHSGKACPRCGAVLDPAIGRRFAPAAGALAAAIPLAIPAYSFSVIVNDQLTAVLEHTVIGTVQMLADRGYWHIGLVLLLAGVVIPTASMLALAWMLYRVRVPSRKGLELRTRVYRVAAKLVRWPMIIPFIAALAAPIVDFRNLDDIVAGPGSTPFFALIVLLMLTVRLFEPRLMWRSAGVTR